MFNIVYRILIDIGSLYQRSFNIYRMVYTRCKILKIIFSKTIFDVYSLTLIYT